MTLRECNIENVSHSSMSRREIPCFSPTSTKKKKSLNSLPANISPAFFSYLNPVYCRSTCVMVTTGAVYPQRSFRVLPSVVWSNVVVWRLNSLKQASSSVWVGTVLSGAKLFNAKQLFTATTPFGKHGVVWIITLLQSRMLETTFVFFPVPDYHLFHHSRITFSLSWMLGCLKHLLLIRESRLMMGKK